MASNPNVSLGTLNRALTSIQVIDNPGLNITAGFFGTKMARITFEGETADYIPSQTGGVPSGRLYQFVTIAAYINMSQGLAAQWEKQRRDNSNIGDVNFITASPTLPDYYVQNCVLMNIPDLDAAGESNDFPLVIRGTYGVNNSLFQ